MNWSYILLILQFYEFSEDRNISTDPNENLTEICSDYTLPDSNFLNLEIERQEEPIDLSFKLKGNNFSFSNLEIERQEEPIDLSFKIIENGYSSKTLLFNDTNRYLAQKRFFQNTFELEKNIPNNPSKKSKPNQNFTISLPKNDSNSTQLSKKHDTPKNKDCVLVNSQDSGIEKPEMYYTIKNDKYIKKINAQINNEKRYDNPDFIFNTKPIINKNIYKLNSSNLDKSIYEKSHTDETKCLQNVSLCNYIINNEKLKLISLEDLKTNDLSRNKLYDNIFQNVNTSENSINNNKKLDDLNESKVGKKNLDSGLHLNNQMLSDINEMKNKIETFKDVNIKNNLFLKTKNVMICVDLCRKIFFKIQKERIDTIKNIIINGKNKCYNIKNWLELKTDILEHIETLKKIIVECTKIDSECLESIFYEIKQLIKMLIIWDSLINQITTDITIPDTSIHDKLKSLLSHIKNTTIGQILFPEIIAYDIKYSYKYTFKEKNLLFQNIIQKQLFITFQIFMNKILNIENISDIITWSQHMKLNIIRQILREFMYFTLESLFLEDFKLLYKHFLHMVLSTNEKKHQTILMGLNLNNYQIYNKTPFNSFSYHFRFIFLFNNPYNYINSEIDGQEVKVVTSNILITDNERLISSYNNMADFLTSFLLNKSLVSFLYSLKNNKGKLESYILLCLIYIQNLNNFFYFSGPIKTIIKVSEINIRNYLKEIKIHNICNPLNDFKMKKIKIEKARILVKIFKVFKDLVKEIDNFELENFSQ